MFSPLPALAQTARFQEKRGAILGAAAQLFNEHGLRGATLADIAGSVGLVTNSVTYYYRRKEDLAKACLLRSIAAFDRVAEEAAGAGDVAGRVAAFLRGHATVLADIQAGRQAPLILFNDIRALPEPQVTEVFDAYTAMFRRVRALLSAPGTAALTRDDLNARAHIVLSIANWMGTWIGRHEPAEYPRAADRVSDVLLHGLGSGTVRWEPAGIEGTWRPPRGDEGSPESFLRAATVLVNEQGYRGASVDRIAARLSLTKGAFYHHHDNKLDLISACFERTFTVMRQALENAEAGPGSGWQRACAAGRALVRFQLSEDGPLLRITATSALPDTARRQNVRTTLRRLTQRMASIVVDGMVDGSMRPLDPSIAAQVTIALMNAAAELERWVPGVDADNVDALYVRPVFEGLLCPGAGQR